MDLGDPAQLLETFGTLGLFVIVFVETGLLLGLFLPGDSLLFAAGVLAAEGRLSIGVVLAGCFVAAVLGDQVGYTIGRRAGRSLERRADSRFFKQAHLARARAFMDHHGSKTIVLARFVPAARTFVPVLAGVGRMRYRTFLLCNVLGALLWAVGVTLLGYGFGAAGASLGHYITLAVGLVLLSTAPPVVRWIRHPRGVPATIAGEPRPPLALGDLAVSEISAS